MTRKMIALIAAATVLTLAACADPPKSGYVYDRKFHPAYYWTQMVCSGYDSKGNCTMNVPIVHYQPDSYELCMMDDKTNKRGCRDATLDEYEHYQIGMHYPNAM